MTLGELYLEAKKHDQLELECLLSFLIKNKHQSFKDDTAELNKYFLERHKSKMNGIIQKELKTRSRAFKTYLVDNRLYARARTEKDLIMKLEKHNVPYNKIEISADDLYDLSSKKVKLPNELTLLGNKY